MPTEVHLRPFRADDAVRLDARRQVPGDIDFFGWTPTNAFARRFAADGMLSEDHGNLVVEVAGETVGDVSWFAVHHGPPPHGRALNIGIALLAEHRGKGYGTQAQRLLVDHLFATTRVERLEASTDVTNLAEQRALTKAGFTREGVLRHSQWRAGAFHDNVLFSRLRGD
jgi:RimJ/RimL family protein N-acetyltransferase